MNIVESVNIHGFWGNRSIKFNFHDDVNFLIGINGSGKTTAINILVAALNANFDLLDKLNFVKIEIKLRAVRGLKKPIIEVVKNDIKGMPFSNIEYRIRNSSSEKPVIYSLDDYEEQLSFRHYPRRMMIREMDRAYGKSIISHLSQLFHVSWLSVNRGAPADERDRKSFESSIDRKIYELSNRLVRYFSSLNKRGSIVLEKFQESFFLSMLIDERRGSIFGIDQTSDIREDQETLNSIFKQFKLDKKKYTTRIDKYFTLLEDARKNLIEEESLKPIDVAALLSKERIDYIIEEWTKATAERELIFKPRETFLSIVNDLMKRKEFGINDQNELFVKTNTIEELPLYHLSSGEKQLLIVLGEALLQEKSSWIYIADEPELSLHVSWQESLVDNIRAINPNAQIIFATHSPDIVSSYGNNVFFMEEVLS